MRDQQYLEKNFRLSEIKHFYGENVHLVSDPYLFTTLAKLCAPECHQPILNQLVSLLYRELVKIVANTEFPLIEGKVKTRMRSFHKEADFEAYLLDPNTKVVSVNLARAGTLPSQVCFDAFNTILEPRGIRQDHISINRETDHKEQVIGTRLGGVKIGGGIDKAYVVFPDPMGATGSTLDTAMEIYKNEVKGKAQKFIAIHLIVTPEYLKRMTTKWKNLKIFALRLDRGLSSKEILKTIPGEVWNKEKGLNHKQYIVPGAGGMGEIINNSYV